MFSGKTEELLRRVRRAKIGRRRVQLFKPAIDNRYHATQVLPHFLAHAGEESVQVGESAHVVSHARDILPLVEADTDLVAIEEAQFLDDYLLDVMRKLSKQGKDLILSLLDQDYRKLPFPISGSGWRNDAIHGSAQPPASLPRARNVGDYLAIAHESLKLAAICVVCGQDAHHSQKLTLHSVSENGEPQYKPASYYTEVVTVGTSQEIAQNKLFAEKKLEFPENIYEARCRNCHVVGDEP